MHIHKNPLLLGTLPAALEGGLDVFIPMVSSQGKRFRRKLSWCIGQDNNSTKKAIIQRDSQLAVTQHYDAAKCQNGFGVEMN
jgi:hypothetical protein